MRQVTLNRQSITQQPGLTSYILAISVASTVNVPTEIFVMQRYKKYDNTISDSFVGVCSPAQLEDLNANSPAEGVSYYRASHIEIVSSALQFLEWAYREIVSEVQLLCSDLIALDAFDSASRVVIDADTVTPTPIHDPNAPSYSLNGTVHIANNVNSGVVTGLGLSFVPDAVVLTVEIPEGGLSIYASVLINSITADGFSYDLSATTDNADYRLTYLLTQ